MKKRKMLSDSRRHSECETNLGLRQKGFACILRQAHDYGFRLSKSFSTASMLAVLFCMTLFSVTSYFLSHQAATMPQPHCDIDSKAYLERGHLFYKTNSFVTPQHPAQPYYALGYPLVIGVLYKLFGASHAVIIVFQLLLALLSCLLMMRLASLLFGQRAAFFASVLFACNIGYLVFVQFILTEIVLSFFLLIFMERLMSFVVSEERNKNNVSHCPLLCYLALAGFALGLSMLIKQAALYFVFVVIALLCAMATVWSQRLRHALIFAACFYIPVLGAMTYNKIVFNNFALGTLDRVNIYYWFYPNVLAAQYGTTADYERNKLLTLSDGRHDFKVVEPLFWRDVSGKPLCFLRIWFINVFKTFIGLYATNLKVLVEPAVHGGSISYFKMTGSLLDKAWSYVVAGATKPWVRVVAFFEVFYGCIRYLLCVIAVIILSRQRRWYELATLIFFIAYFSLITGHDGCARFRMMFEFLLITLAAGGCTYILKREKGT